MLHDKAFSIAKSSKNDLYQHRIDLIIYIFFVKKVSGWANKGAVISNQRTLDLTGLAKATISKRITQAK